jgi:AcrR family transcriptional regulator
MPANRTSRKTSKGRAIFTASGQPSGTRRRGSALEKAIFDAVWDEIAKVGYARLTMDAIAARAGTSKPVLYRRWSGRAELVLAALRDRAPMLSGEVPDMGSLRKDVLALLGRVSRGLGNVGPETLFGLLSDSFADSKTFNSLRNNGLHAGAEAMSIIIQRARERGEISSDHIPMQIVTLPVDLARHEALVNGSAISEQALVGIVDNIFLPLVLRSSKSDSSGSVVHKRRANRRNTNSK